jgi:adenosylcobyric acid synthase
MGVVPFYHDILIDSEDSVAIQKDRRRGEPVSHNTVNIGVLGLPAISNFTDLEILVRERDVVVNYLRRPDELKPDYDCLILPGTKNVMEDARWLGRSGWKRRIRSFAESGRCVLGLCGGYQLLGQWVVDPDGMESPRGKIRGLGVLPLETVLESEKVVRRVSGLCLWNEKRVSGYEIHMGRTRPLGGAGGPFLRIREPGDNHAWEDGWMDDTGCVMGTYVHGLLDMPGFRCSFLNRLRKAKGLKERKPRQGRLARFHQYDRLADHFERHCDWERILASAR